MFTFRSTFLIVALSTMGFAGWTVGNDNQEGPAVAASAAIAASPGGAALDRQPVIVLLRDGRIVKGELSEEDGIFTVTQPIGVMRFPTKRVEKVFASIQEVYSYKLEQLPENDFDERIKLARWCLEQKLEPEARQQLDAILKRSPKHGQARAMLSSLDQAQSRLANRLRDPEVQQTRAELARTPTGERPNTLDTAVIYGARRGMGISDLPVIFDLPTSQAVKRTDEFARYVHPVLQAYCARCHNESYDGEFQLVQIKSKLDRTRDALRANLDASLKLIDRDYPPRSELLASSLRPHGRGPTMRPIFQGSNDRAYQILATWVNKLRATSVAEGAVQAKPHSDSPGVEPDESFASQRGHSLEETEQVGTATGPFVTGPVTNKTLPPVRVVPGKGVIPETSVDPNEFPLPFAVSGTKPKIATKSPLTQKTVTKAVKPGGSAGSNPTGGGRDMAEDAAPARKRTEPSHSTNTAVGADPAVSSNNSSDPDDADSAKKKPRKPLSLDPALLQRALQLRNQGREPGTP
jgi:hypothetical protein